MSSSSPAAPWLGGFAACPGTAALMQWTQRENLGPQVVAARLAPTSQALTRASLNEFLLEPEFGF